MIDAPGRDESAGGMAAKRGRVGGKNDGDRMGDAVLRSSLHAMQVEQSLDAPAAIGRGNVGRIEIAGGVAGVIEIVDFANVEFAAGVHAHAGGDGLAVLCDGGENGGRAGGELLAAPGFVETLVGEDREESGEVAVVGLRDPVQ